jgi:hypothetical protein
VLDGVLDERVEDRLEPGPVGLDDRVVEQLDLPGALGRAAPAGRDVGEQVPDLDRLALQRPGRDRLVEGGEGGGGEGPAPSRPERRSRTSSV